MVVGFTTTSVIIAYDASSNPVHGEVDSIQDYAIKFVSDIFESGVKHHNLNPSCLNGPFGKS